MLGHDAEVVRVDAPVLRCRFEEVLGVVHQVLVDGVVPGDQHRQRGGLPTTGPAGLLPRRGDGARVAGDDARIEAADVDAELERVRRHDALHVAVAEPPLDAPSLLGQVATAVSLGALSQPFVSLRFEALFELSGEDLDLFT